MRQMLNEMRRFAWSDLSLHRIIGMPVVLLILFLLLVQKPSGNGLPYVLQMIVFGFGVVVLIWGAFNAAGSVPEEHRIGSWDNVRLSPVSPFVFMWGRLLGCAIYQWYAGLILLIFYVSYAFNVYPVEIVLVQLSAMIFLTLFCHSVAMLTSLHAGGGPQGVRRFVGGGCFVFSIIVAGMLYFPLMGYMRHALRSFSSLRYTNYKVPQMEWFGFSLPSYQMWTIVIAAFCLWSLVGLYRTLRKEFKFPVIPWVWGGFVLFCMAFASGFFESSAVSARHIFGFGHPYRGHEASMVHIPLQSLVAICVGYALVYVAMAVDAVDATQYRKLVYHYQHKNWWKVAELTPAWMVTFGMVLMVILLHLFLVPIMQGAPEIIHKMLVIGLFVLRDIGIMHFFAFSPRNRRAMLVSVFYLVVLYVLLPIIVNVAGADEMMVLFYPHNYAGVQVIILLAEAGAVWWLATKRWKRLQKLG